MQIVFRLGGKYKVYLFIRKGRGTIMSIQGKNFIAADNLKQ